MYYQSMNVVYNMLLNMYCSISMQTPEVVAKKGYPYQVGKKPEPMTGGGQLDELSQEISQKVS